MKYTYIYIYISGK